ncbi:CYTH domain-containing protein [Sneathiella glossodoripedis]|uniref:CYTH domain-containing protein n=1 Tax=Sneathiella glossodoripedis TaxID=418853 RepID=UPI00046FC999|nr:CYTH domain-containing protein [Sneathiella glossodoripedis]
MEIERKFLVKENSWKSQIIDRFEIEQIYLTTPDHVPTVRLRSQNERAYITLKYPSSDDQVLARAEFEYEIPESDVNAQLSQAKGNPIQKTRFLVKDEFNQRWEVDEFLQPNEGLILAEIELSDIEQEIQLPEWIGKEVTADKKYSNIEMAFSKNINLNRG